MIVNDRLDVALMAKVAGAHLGDRDLPIDVARKLAGPDFILGTSTHSLEQAQRAQETACDYIALGPIFATDSKRDAQPVVGLEALRRAASVIDKPLVAIGGINRDNMRDVLEAGADSVALISAVMVRDRVCERMGELLGLAGG